MISAVLLAAALAAASPPPAPWFVDRAAAWGLDFVHFNGMSGELYYVENMGSGCGLLDYDGDGDLDAYLVQGEMLGPGKDVADATFPPPPGMLPLSDRLFRNDLGGRPDGGVEPRFVDVSAAAGLGADGYGLGVAAGDVDGDGRVDLFLSNFGADRLLRNRGDGTFEDATAASGVADPRLSVGAAFLDVDGDRHLDLYVAENVDFGFANHHLCFSAAGAPDYCGPLSFRAAPDRLLRNRGDGTFEDASARAGIVESTGNGLGAVAGDFDADGRADVFVANDRTPNFLWRNRGDGTFEELGLLAGVALDEGGKSQGSMGIAAGDLDRDGDEDLLVTNFVQETNALYENEGGGLFRDATLGSGLGPPSIPFSGFGTGWLDADGDGLLDLAVFNGQVSLIPALAQAGDPYPLDQAHQLYRQEPAGRFADRSTLAGGDFAAPSVARGAAFGDVDNDGDADLLVSNNAGPARLLINQVGAAAGWLGVDARDGRGEAAVGAWVRLEQGPARPARWVRYSGSYASVNDPRSLFGLGVQAEGGAPAAERLTLRWPGGRRLALLRPPAGLYLVFAEPGGGAAGAQR